MTVEQESVEDPQEPTPTAAELMAADLTELTADPVEPTVDEGTDPEAGSEPATGSEPQPTPQTIKIGETEIPADQVGGIENLIGWASSLSEEQASIAAELSTISEDKAKAILAVLKGEAAPAAPAEPPPDPIAAIESDYPEIAAAFRAQQEELASLRTAERRLEKLEMVTAAEVTRNTQEAALETEQRVKAEFLEANGLDEAEYARLVANVAPLNILPNLVETLGMEAGMRKTLDFALSTDPEIQQKAITKALQSANTSAGIAAKQAKAAGLSPQGGSAPKTTAANQVGLPQDQRKAAMTEEIRQLMES